VPVRPTRARRLVDHLAGHRTRNNRVGDTEYIWPRTEGRADQAGATRNRLWVTLNDAFKHRSRGIFLPDIYTETR
jgi:hypothetical protein